MAPYNQKGLRSIPKLKSRYRKRLKSESDQKSDSTDPRKPIQLEALPWNQVELPTKIENAEGFLGLEEVDGVEIIREGGRIEFNIAATQSVGEYSDFDGFDDEELTVLESKKSKSAKYSPIQITEIEKTDKICNWKYDKEKASMLDSFNANAFNLLTGVVSTREIDMSVWVKLGLSSNLLSAISKLGFSEPTHIQSAAIPEILSGHDVIGKASTGSGKTLAFAVPIVEVWLELYGNLDEDKKMEQKTTTALILSPTRELAHQLTDHISALCRELPRAPLVISITGGLSIQKQQRQICKADIIIGTPGRLWEVIGSSQQILESLKCIRFLVIDEADRLLAENHFKQAEEIINALNHQLVDEQDNQIIPTRQTLVFSATFHRGLQQNLTGKGKQGLKHCNDSMEYLLKKIEFREKMPKFIDVNPVSHMADKLKEGIIECSGIEKDLYLYALLLYHPKQRTLIFTNSINSVRRLNPLLQNLGLSSQALHSQMAQKARMRSIERFSSPNLVGSILVATDVAARGLDIKGVQLVIHYHLPRTADMYVHRSGRTARAESSGSSILLCAPEEMMGIRRLIAKVHVQNAVSQKSCKVKSYLKTLDINRNVVIRLKPRISLAKKIADISIAKEKKSYDDAWMRSAAHELGVDYDSNENDRNSRERLGKDTRRILREQEAREITKSELLILREELKLLLAQRINVGISDKYLADGRVNLNAILSGVKEEFLGTVDGIGFE